MALTNGGFETPDGTVGPGQADGWTVSVTSTAESYAEFAVDPGAVPADESTNAQEEFDSGWQLPESQTFVDAYSGFFVDLTPAFFDDSPTAFEDFENEWSIVAGTTHNGIADSISGIDLAQFDGGTPAGLTDVEDFENGWNAPTDVLIPVYDDLDPNVPLDPAVFDSGSPELFEDYEDEWGQPYVFAYTGIGVDLGAAFFSEPGPTLVQQERFGEAGTRFEISGLIVDTGADTINDGGGNFLNLERVQFRVEGGTPADPIQVGTFYRVRNVSSPTFQISETTTSPIIDLTTAGTGALFVKGDPVVFWVDELTGV